MDIFDSEKWVASLFLGTTLIAVLVAARAWALGTGPLWRYLAMAMASTAVWCLGDAMLFLSTNVAERQFWLVFAYIGRMAGVPLIFSFALCFAHLDHLLTRTWRLLLWTPFGLAMILAVTNRWHQLIWSNPVVDPLGLTGEEGHGIYFLIMLPIIYGLLAATVVIFLQHCWQLRHIYRQQAIVLSVAVLLPLAASFLYVTDLNPLPSVDLAPLAFAFTGLLALYSMRRLHLIDLRPIYRDTLFEQMIDGAIVVDSTGRIADLNTAARTTLAADPDPIGRPAAALLTGLFGVDAPRVLQPGFHETMETAEPPPRYLNVRVTALDAAPGHDGALLVVWRNVTTLHKAVATIYEQERVLTVIAERERAERELATQIEALLHVVEAQVQAALKNLDNGRPGVAATYLAQLSGVAAEAQRSASAQLHMFEPAESDFLPAVERYAEHFSTIHRLQASVVAKDADVVERLGPEQRLQGVRIMQEAMENSRQHAQAQSIQISFVASTNAVTMTVTDDGVGFDLDREAGCQGPGVESLYRRARSVDAELKLNSAPGCGTTIQVAFPNTADHAHHALKGLRVVVADHHPLVLEGLSELLTNEGALIIAMATSGEEAVAAVASLQVELVLLDLDMPGDGSIIALQQIKRADPAVKVVLLSTSDQDPKLSIALHQGAEGYLLKSLDTEHFFALLAQVASDEMPLAPGLAKLVLAEFRREDPGEAPDVTTLTARQQEILGLVAQGITYVDIGERLFLSERTVRYHTEQLRRQLKLANRSKLAEYARRHGLSARA